MVIRLLLATDDLIGRASQILDQRDAKRDGDGPELADGQGLHALVGAYEPAKHFRIESAVGMRNKCPGQSVDARISPEVTLRQLGEFSIIAGRQVVVDFAQLFVDDMIIVDQPFGRRCDCALLTDCLGGCTIRFEQHPAVVEHPRQQRTTLARSRRDALSRGEAFPVLLKTLAAEEFGPNRFFKP